MATSYEFATGSVRVRENALLTTGDLEQLSASPDEATLVALLRDKGFGDPAAPADTAEELLRQQMTATWRYLFSILPDDTLLDAFLIRNDLHNVKLILKGTLGDREVDALLMEPYRTEPTVIRDAVKTKHFTELPDWMGEALSTAYDILAQSSDAQRADAVLDCAAMGAMQQAADASGVPLLRQIVEATVFYADVTVAIRAARVHMPVSYLDLALCPCEGVELDNWKKAVTGGESELLDLLGHTNAFRCEDAVEQYRRAPAFFEKWVDDYLLSLAREGKGVTAGAEPLLGYLMARQAEDKAVRMAATGIRTGQSAADVQERMRELYG